MKILLLALTLFSTSFAFAELGPKTREVIDGKYTCAIQTDVKGYNLLYFGDGGVVGTFIVESEDELLEGYIRGFIERKKCKKLEGDFKAYEFIQKIQSNKYTCTLVRVDGFNQLYVDGKFKGNFSTIREKSRLDETLKKMLEKGDCIHL